MRRIFDNGRYANVTATLALVLAMGGTSYAAMTLPHNSVGSTQIRPRAVKGSDIARNAVTSDQVRNGSLRAQDFAFGQLPVGVPGPTGPQGPRGAAAAYARIVAAGGIYQGTPPQGEGFMASNIEHDTTTGIGVYCIGGLPFTPRSGIVTVDGSGPGAAAASTTIGSLAMQAGTVLTNCDAAHQQARITMTRVDANGSTLSDHGLYVWFEE